LISPPILTILTNTKWYVKEKNMGNSNKPFGARLVGHLTGNVGAAGVHRYRLDVSQGTSAYVGDFVSLDVETYEFIQTATPGLNQMDGAKLVKPATASSALVGVITGFAYDPTNLGLNYRQASTARDCFVCDDPSAIFEIQSDSTGIASTTMNQNCNFTATTGSTVTGVSAFVATGAATTATLPLKIFSAVVDNKNDLTSAAYIRIKVLINNHQYGQGTGTVGI
jgi:hypothetical protein